ncbi:MAG: hypothetical protein ACR2PZ_24640, partial [Pseudomonadales bacterium]
HLLRVQKEAVAYNDIGYIALLNGDLDQAEHLLNRAVALSPRHYEQAQENLQQLRLTRSSITLNKLEKSAQGTTKKLFTQPQVASIEAPVSPATVPPAITKVPTPAIADKPVPVSVAAPSIKPSVTLRSETKASVAESSIVTPEPDASNVDLPEAASPMPPELPATIAPISSAQTSATPPAVADSSLSLDTCPTTAWPSACRLCLSDYDPAHCLATAVESRDSYKPKD